MTFELEDGRPLVRTSRVALAEALHSASAGLAARALDVRPSAGVQDDLAPLGASRLALAASLRAASLGRGAIAVMGLPFIGARGWGPAWLVSLRFAGAEARRWRALVVEVMRHHTRTPLKEEMEEKARELFRVERQARLLLAEVARTLGMPGDSSPLSDSTPCDLKTGRDTPE